MIETARRVASVLTAIAAAAILQLGAALAAGEDVFVVARVPVQAQGDSATAAKTTAQAEGRRRAMDILLRRLTVEEDWTYLPRLAAGQLAAGGADPDKRAISLTDQDLETLESGFEVYGEKSSAATYRAFITYRFKPESVRRLLKEAKLPYSETQTRAALVLPVLETATGLYLWEENNPWMAAWKSRPYTHELTPMSAPLGDLEDAARVNPRQALSLDPAALEAAAQHYGVSQVIVAHARLLQTNGEDRLSVRLVNGYRERPDAPVLDALDPALGAFDSNDYDSIAAPPVEDISAKVGDVLAEVRLVEPSGDFPSLAERAIETVIARYASGWKAKTLIDHTSEGILETSAFFQSIDEWTKIRAGLNATPLVSSIQVFALSPRGAEMRLKVFGDPSRLAVALEAYGVDFWSENGGEHWLLATPAQARSLRGDRTLRRRRADFGDAVFDPALPEAPQVEPASGTSEDEMAPDSKIDGRF